MRVCVCVLGGYIPSLFAQGMNYMNKMECGHQKPTGDLNPLYTYSPKHMEKETYDRESV